MGRVRAPIAAMEVSCIWILRFSVGFESGAWLVLPPL
jgi:hypothetical protein